MPTVETPQNCNAHLERLLVGHGFAVVPHKEWLVVNDQLPGLAAWIANPRASGAGQRLVRLDIKAAFNAETIIVESFGGLGETHDDAIANAFRNFAINSFHVFLAAFFNRDDPEVTVEEWWIGGGLWDVFIGNLGVRGCRAGDIGMLDRIFPVIEGEIRDRAPAGDLHWCRAYYARGMGPEPASEALFDNEDWPALASKMAVLPWPDLNAFYSVRNFLIMRKREVEQETPGLG